jgi:hypothetical protein
MFAPRPDLVAKELLRVCVPAGTIAMANWTPQGFIGQMFKTVSTFIAPSGMPSPVLWGNEPTVRDGSARDCRISTWSGVTMCSVTPFLPQRWWSSSASTMDRPIKHSRPSMTMVESVFAENLKGSGLLTIERGRTAPQSSLNISK